MAPDEACRHHSTKLQMLETVTTSVFDDVAFAVGRSLRLTFDYATSMARHRRDLNHGIVLNTESERIARKWRARQPNRVQQNQRYLVKRQATCERALRCFHRQSPYH